MPEEKTLKIISWNVNGIRACARKGLLDYLKSEEPDILCLQEIKAKADVLEEELHCPPGGYKSAFHSAQRPGYSGVAIYTKPSPLTVSEGFGNDKFDAEGRVIWAEYPGFYLFNVYFPNGQRDQERLTYKFNFYEAFFAFCEDIRKMGKPVIICGDYNTAHTEIDLANPKENQNYSGFLPEERAWIDRLITMGYVDTFRQYNKEPDQYSWWTYRFGARRRNIGWRIDYFFITENGLPMLKDAFIQPQIEGSDHCPVGIILSA